ncbi:hypothetical protein HDU78_011730 [Chytriomyces hyalinus]|nr:hypothetical protein HDU78_011730 [Chytriomyces hyalinus]KAJ3263989.1 hypothetical protein HDU77_009639 [Chytriomyces hyalinus]
MNITLKALSGTFQVARWKPAAITQLWSQLLPLTEPKQDPSLFSLNVTSTETSLVCSTSLTLPSAGPESPVAIESGYAAFVVEGTLDFALVGILAAITSSLAEAKISVFAVSTYDTDYILVKEDKVAGAIEAWTKSNVQGVAIRVVS